MGWPPHPPHRAMLLLPWGFGKKRLEVSCEAEDKWEISHQWLPDWNHCEFYAKPTFTSVVRRSGQQEKNGLAKRRRCSYGALHPQKPFKTVDSPSMHRGLIPAPRSWDSPSMHRVANTRPRSCNSPSMHRDGLDSPDPGILPACTGWLILS